jgi:hypothetical protein
MMLDTQVMLNLMRQQLIWLEGEILFLRERMAQSTLASPPARTFSSLRGIWAGVTVNEEDFEAARLQLPDDV